MISNTNFQSNPRKQLMTHARVTRPCTFVQHVHLYNELENKCTFSGYPDRKMFSENLTKKDVFESFFVKFSELVKIQSFFVKLSSFFFFVFLTKNGLQKAAIWFE